MKNYKASIGSTSFEISLVSDSVVEIDGRACNFSVESLGGKSYTLLLGGRCHVVEFVANGLPSGDDDEGMPGPRWTVSLQGRQYVVSVNDERSALLGSVLFKSRSASGALVVQAPMPGLISRIEVQLDQEVLKGAGLLVLEAMKMENEIRASASGRVKAIHVAKGDPVEKGAVLISLEKT